MSFPKENSLLELSQTVGSVFAGRILTTFTEGKSCPFLSPVQLEMAPESLVPPPNKASLRAAYRNYCNTILVSLQANFAENPPVNGVPQLRLLAESMLVGCPGDWATRWNQKTKAFLQYVASADDLSSEDQKISNDVLAYSQSAVALVDVIVDKLQLPKPQQRTCEDFDTTGIILLNEQTTVKGELFNSVWIALEASWPGLPAETRRKLSEKPHRSPYQFVRPIWYLAEAVTLHLMANGSNDIMKADEDAVSFVSGRIHPLMDDIMAKQVALLRVHRPVQQVATAFLEHRDANIVPKNGRQRRPSSVPNVVGHPDPAVPALGTPKVATEEPQNEMRDTAPQGRKRARENEAQVEEPQRAKRVKLEPETAAAPNLEGSRRSGRIRCPPKKVREWEAEEGWPLKAH